MVMSVLHMVSLQVDGIILLASLCLLRRRFLAALNPGPYHFRGECRAPSHGPDHDNHMIVGSKSDEEDVQTTLISQPPLL